jgi:hypothetical protein
MTYPVLENARYVSNLRCAHCGRSIHEHSVNDAIGNRAHIVSTGTFQGPNQTYDRIYLVCEGECDRALRSVIQSDARPLGTDFLVGAQSTPFEECEPLTDVATYSSDWLSRWAQRVHSRAVASDQIPTLRSIARLVNTIAAAAASEKRAS